jgi:hypothetical protein
MGSSAVRLMTFHDNGHAAYIIDTTLPETPEISPDRHEPISRETCPCSTMSRQAMTFETIAGLTDVSHRLR